MPTGQSPVAIITGASGGLGSIVTPKFLDRGYRVTAIADEWPRKPRASKALQILRSDLTTSAAAGAAVKQSLQRYGRIDALVHLVGSFEGGTTIDKTADDVWDRMLAVNLRAAVNMMRVVIPPMRRRRSGRIIVVGSTAATPQGAAAVARPAASPLPSLARRNGFAGRALIHAGNARQTPSCVAEMLTSCSARSLSV